MPIAAIQAAVGVIPSAVPQQAVVAIEDAFTTYVYTGDGSTGRDIVNGQNLTESDGLVWVKSRSITGNNHLADTVRGEELHIFSNLQSAEFTYTDRIIGFNSDGFTLGSDNQVNATGEDYVSWTFRDYDRFFTLTEVSHTNGSDTTVDLSKLNEVGMVTVKRVDDTSDWFLHHRNHSAGKIQYLNKSDSETTDNSIDVSGTDLIIDSTLPSGTYMVYAWAHDPLGPSGDGSDGLIACGQYTGDGNDPGPLSDLGWEPQFLLRISKTNIRAKFMIDNIRGVVSNGADSDLRPGANNSESTRNIYYFRPNGFEPTDDASVNSNGEEFIYLAIRRGPMKEPESGSDVFAVNTRVSKDGNVGAFSSGWPVDFAFWANVTNTFDQIVSARLMQGFNMRINKDDSQTSNNAEFFDFEDGWFDNSGTSSDQNSWMFRRYPKVFDVVTYVGDGSTGRTVAHNLGVVPEFMFVKRRNNTSFWAGYHKNINVDGDGRPETDYIRVETDSGAADFDTLWNDTAPTNSDFTVGNGVQVNGSGDNYIAFLFATLSGISKVGGYTGTGSSQTIDCGFTTGARFVWIKRWDASGDWIMWDSARGIVSGNEPYLETNTSNAQVTGNDYIDPDNSGFIINGGFADVNANGGEYIFLAFA